MATRTSKTTPKTVAASKTATSKTATAKTATTKTAKGQAAAPRSSTPPKTSLTAAAKAAVATTPEPLETSPTPVVSALKPVVTGPTMRKRELIEAVVKKSGIKKKDAKPVIEAMLLVLGSALQDGRELNLQPLGKIKINRERKRPEGKVMIAKIRQARDLPTSEVAAPSADDTDATDTPAAAE